MKIFDNNSILTVSEITHAIKNDLENRYRFVRVSGEISNLSTPYSGHSYFILKDDSAQIRGVLFKQQKRFIELALENGQQVICFGRITVYEPRGEYQLVVDSVQLEGEGQLQLAFENLKKKLHAKGFFDNERKKNLPKYPEKIAVITSPTGAAIQDFLKIVAIRQSTIQIQILPVRVQGDKAAEEIAQAIELTDSFDDLDIIVLCRGGGSLEDLWAFNEEIVARAIFNSKVPLVTGIGHEIDFTIADFCSDFRCPTPTAVAEKIIPDTKLLTDTISILLDKLLRSIRANFFFFETKLQQQTRQLQNYKNRFDSESFRLHMSRSYMINALVNNLREKENSLNNLQNRLHSQAPNHQIALQARHVQYLLKQLKDKMLRIIEQKQASLGGEAKLLHSVSPLATLGRGYSITRTTSSESKAHQVITTVNQTEIGDQVNILLHQGELECEVKKKIDYS